MSNSPSMPPSAPLSVLRQCLDEAEGELDRAAIVDLCVFDTPSGPLAVHVTERLRRACQRWRVWKTPGMLSTLRNAKYGLDRQHARSRGGSDGVFLLDRTHQPPNAMMRKLFDRFLDKPDALVEEICGRFDDRPETMLPVRVVSHHMRLLGVLLARAEQAQLILVDYDDS